MIGIDAVDVERLRTVMGRSEGTEHRLFTPAERNYCRTKGDPVIHFAGTLAVKEAVIKAARLGSLVAWGRRIEVRRDPSGAPLVKILGSPQRRFDISISHDGPVAVAVAVARGGAGVVGGDAAQERGSPLRPNEQLLRYIEGPRGRLKARSHLREASHSVVGSDFP